MKKTMGSAKAMMNPKGGKGMGTGGKTKDPADKKKSGPMQGPGGLTPGGMKSGKVKSTTTNKKYC